MSSSDKTGQKLVDSMRRTKAAAAERSTGETAPAQGARKGGSQTQSRKKPAGGSAAKRSTGRAADPYQSGRRVWPD